MMDQRIFYTPGGSDALRYAVQELEQRGVRFADAPDSTVTHLLLSVPCREPVDAVLKSLSPTVTVVGGALTQESLMSYPRIDLLENPAYVAKNAQITAHCALGIAIGRLSVTLEHCPVLVLGWGRIGKCLAQLLRACGADVTVAARKEHDRAMLTALGYDAEDINALGFCLKRYRAIFNTVPSPVLSSAQLAHCRPDCLKIELASTPGIAGDDVIQARGLPGKLAPESSGKLIARTVFRLCARKEAAQ